MLLRLKRISSLYGILWVAGFALFLVLAQPACAQERETDARTGSSALASPIKFFQKYISRADGDRCVMHPSCSQYAADAFERHGAIKGWILACDRLLRGGHDEVRLSPKVRVNGRLLTYDPVEANTRWWSKP